MVPGTSPPERVKNAPKCDKANIDLGFMRFSLTANGRQLTLIGKEHGMADQSQRSFSPARNCGLQSYKITWLVFNGLWIAVVTL